MKNHKNLHAARTKAAALAGAIALAVLLSAPAASLAQSETKSYAVALTQTGILAAPGPYTGELRLQTWPDGIVTGWYVPNYGGRLIPVTGGLSADGQLWLDIGERGNLHVTAMRQPDGSFKGSAVNIVAVTPYPVTFAFEATPQRS